MNLLNYSSDSDQEPDGLPPPPPGLSPNAAQNEWFAKVWSRKNRSFNMPAHSAARESLRSKLSRVEWCDAVSLPLFVERQKDLLNMWAPGAWSAEWVPSAVDCEATRLMNRLVMPESIVALLADAGFNAYKCCDPDLSAEEKRMGAKAEKRSASETREELGEASGAKRTKMEVEVEAEAEEEEAVFRNTSAPSPTTDSSSSVSTPSTSAAETASETSAEETVAGIKREANTTKPASAESQAKPEATACKKADEIIITPITPINVPQTTSTAETTMTITSPTFRTPALDLDAAIQNAISAKTAEISAVLAAQVRQHGEAQQRLRDEGVRKVLGVLQHHARSVREAVAEEEKAREMLRAALGEDERARRNLRLSLEMLDDSLARAGEQLVAGKGADDDCCG
ncbi:hypothetical protein CSOJ01_06445 [Colletotrichum sojae]|uniref:Uncharacterized protein n=1 Tax=Colletotrichum sojae TaxID=2175907 RepID=A0A8H6JBV8_9PEZI|nr:hypothetical protein CSOJ01_06445 [Colletotrichum sojae]